MKLFDRLRKSLRFIASATACLLISGFASALPAQHTDKNKATLHYYIQMDPNRMPIFKEGLKPPAPASVPNKTAPMPKRYSFSTPFIWTFELFLLIYGLAAAVYYYRKFKTRLYRTR